MQRISAKAIMKGDILMNIAALTLVIVGALNWLLVGLFQFDVVAWLFGGADSLLARIVYVVVAIAAIWCISLLFKDKEFAPDREADYQDV